MKKLKLLTASIAVLSIMATSCKKESSIENVGSKDLQNNGIAGGRPDMQMSLEAQKKLRDLRASLPAGFEKRAQRTVNRNLLTNPEFQGLAHRAMDPAACNDNTAINIWLGGQLSDWNTNIYGLASQLGMLDFPTYDALLFENSSKNQYFGVNGEYTQPLTKTFKDLKRFWNIQSNDMVMAAMHGNMLLDREKLIRIDRILYGDDLPTAEYYADYILSAIAAVPQYRNGDHPIFTFNAFAQRSFTFSPVGTIPNKIIMGDGILDGFTAIGFKDIAPQAILAHEFGHQVQFQLGLFGNVTSPEATRRTELMADAYAAYYLSHARGASMQWKRVQQFLQVFFNIGDCSFTSDGHHGTPTQRMAAAQWASNLSNVAQKQGHIMTSQEFARLFDAQLPAILAR